MMHVSPGSFDLPQTRLAGYPTVPTPAFSTERFRYSSSGATGMDFGLHANPRGERAASFCLGNPRCDLPGSTACRADARPWSFTGCSSSTLKTRATAWSPGSTPCWECWPGSYRLIRLRCRYGEKFSKENSDDRGKTKRTSLVGAPAAVHDRSRLSRKLGGQGPTRNMRRSFCRPRSSSPICACGERISKAGRRHGLWNSRTRYEPCSVRAGSPGAGRRCSAPAADCLSGSHVSHRPAFSKLSGYAPALPTPFNDAGNIDSAAFVRLCELQIANGATALVVCGTTGEAPTLSPDEHRDLFAWRFRSPTAGSR